MNFKFEVKNTALKQKKIYATPNNPSNDFFCSFLFTSKEWCYLEKYIIFWDSKGKSTIKSMGKMNETRCKIPKELLNDSFFYIQVYANEKIKTSKIKIMKRCFKTIKKKKKKIQKQISDEKFYADVSQKGTGSNTYMDLYVINEDSNNGTHIIINKNGAYYYKSKRPKKEDEIVTKKFLNKYYYDRVQFDKKIVEVNNFGDITVEKKSSSRYLATYVIKYNGEQVGTEINIPKDFLLKSASKEVVGSIPNKIERDNNLSEGDVYLKFVVNTVKNDNETVLIINVNDLLDNISYTADENTLTLSDTEFSIKQDIVDSWITDTDIENKVNDYIDSIIETLNS